MSGKLTYHLTKEKEQPMGQKDITEKLLEDYNDVFADIINGLIFNGETANFAGVSGKYSGSFSI